MTYNRTHWENGNTYGAEAFNNIEEGIVGLEAQLEEIKTSGGSGDKFTKMQTINMAKAVKKLRSNEATDICFMGDSVFYAYNQGYDAEEEPCVPDHGGTLNGYKRSPVTIYDTFLEVMNKVYEGNITITKKIFTGDTAIKAYDHWNPSGSDFAIINFGINDAMGGHVDKVTPNYRGQVDKYIEAYRKLVEREIENGTAVVVLSPTKQTVNSPNDTGDRTLIDIYEQATFSFCQEYNIPCINGNDMVKNFGNDMSIDFTHFTQDGFRAVGYRLASVFIGQSPERPMVVTDGSYLGINPQLDNVNIVRPTILESSRYSPNLPLELTSEDLEYPAQKVEHGLQAVIKGNGKVVWSFYCDRDGMVVVPSIYSASLGVTAHMKLDFGAKQGKWSNQWNNVGLEINRDYEEPAEITITNSELIGHGNKSYGLHVLKYDNQPVIKITTAGWHTIEMSASFPESRSIDPDQIGNGSVSVFGLNFLSLDSYNQRVIKKEALELDNNTTAESGVKAPFLVTQGNKAQLMGGIAGFTVSADSPVAHFDASYAPKTDVVVPVATGVNGVGGYGAVLVKSTGEVFVTHATNTSACSLNGVSWLIGE